MPPVSIPKLCRHKNRSQGYVTLNGREHYLGQWPASRGTKPPPSVQSAYDELIGRWIAGGRQLSEIRSENLSVNELLVAYLTWAAAHYIPKRQKDDQNRFIRYAASVVRELFGCTPAADFGPKKLRLVQRAMADRGWARSTVNAQVDRVKRMFKWAVSEELLSGEVYHAMCTVEGLRKGTPEVRDKDPIKPVSVENVEAVLAFLQPTLQTMVRVQLLTGMRPGEVCQLRASDIETTDPSGVWMFRPAQHKTQHHGHDRVVIIGPQAQGVLRPHIDAGEAYVFSPKLPSVSGTRPGGRTARHR